MMTIMIMICGEKAYTIGILDCRKNKNAWEYKFTSTCCHPTPLVYNTLKSDSSGGVPPLKVSLNPPIYYCCKFE